MSDPAQLLVDHLDIWTGAIERKSGSGRGNGGKISLYGIDKLRSLILDLAVRGKLVPQDPSDGDAGELLRQISAPRDKIIREGKFKSLTTRDRRSPDEAPFPLPPNWVWCLLDDIAGIARGGSPRPIKSFLTSSDDGIPWIKIGDSNRGSTYIEETEERITPEGLHKSRLVIPGDLILSNSMSFGFPYIMKIEGAIHDGWLVIRPPSDLIEKRFLQTLFLSPFAKRSFEDAASGAVVQNLNADKVRTLQIPLPPLSEQKRIVAKVDELMALVDALEAGTRAGMAAHETLVRELLATLVNSQDLGDLARNWSRIEAHFDTLFTTEDSIDALKQIVFDLAVRGKLVPQDPADGDAGELIHALDQQASKPSLRKLVSKYFQKGPLAHNSEPFAVPSNWAWVNVAKLGHNWGQSEPEAEFTYIDVGSIDQRAGVVIEPNIVEAEDAPSRARKIVRRGTVIYSTVRPYLLNIAVIDTEFDPSPIASTAFAVIHPFAGVDGQYVYRVLRSPFFVKYVEGCQTGIAYPAINDKQFFSGPFPLPPLAEQKRIVAKVDELMALCDQLKIGFAQAAERRKQLSNAFTQQAVA